MSSFACDVYDKYSTDKVDNFWNLYKIKEKSSSNVQVFIIVNVFGLWVALFNFCTFL